MTSFLRLSVALPASDETTNEHLQDVLSEVLQRCGRRAANDPLKASSYV